MRIAFVSLMDAAPWGGSEELWYRAAKLALSQGHTVCSLTQQWSVVPNKIAELATLGAKTEFYYKPLVSLAGRIANRLKLRPVVPMVVPVLDADVYIISMGTSWSFIYFRQISDQFTRLNKPYVLISQHGFENGSVVEDRDRPYAIDVIQRATNFFFVSQRNLESAERQLACRISNARIISNPLNAGSNKKVKPYPPSSTLLMACVARLDCAYKGQDILLQTLSGPQWTNRDFKLKLYGTGPHASYLQRLIELYGLQSNVALEGHVSEVDRIWDTNQVLVLPSLNEGTPLSLLEAMMAGRAALATDVGDNGRYVLTGRTGILVDTASVNSLSTGLDDLWHAKDQLEAMGQRAFHHATAITDFAPEQTLLTYLATLLQ